MEYKFKAVSNFASEIDGPLKRPRFPLLFYVEELLIIFKNMTQKTAIISLRLV